MVSCGDTCANCFQFDVRDSWGVECLEVFLWIRHKLRTWWQRGVYSYSLFHLRECSISQCCCIKDLLTCSASSSAIGNIYNCAQSCAHSYEHFFQVVVVAASAAAAQVTFSYSALQNSHSCPQTTVSLVSFWIASRLLRALEWALLYWKLMKLPAEWRDVVTPTCFRE